MPRRPLKYRELIKRLKPYGVIVMGGSRGKGSERILLKPLTPGSQQGPQYPLKHHGEGTEISVPVILALLRRFGIDPQTFWE